MNSDPLSDVLRHVQIRAAVFYYVNLGPSWAVEASSASHIAAAVLPGATQVMEFHLFARGAGWACVDGLDPVRIAEGDIVVFPQGDQHVLCSDLSIRPFRRDPAWVRSTATQPRPMPITYHQGANELVVAHPMQEAQTVLVCGFLGCDTRMFKPFFASLPRILHVPANRNSPWMAAVVDQAARESNGRTPGGSAVLERLSEMMFVDTVRRYLEDLPDGETGWFAAARDRYVGNAIAAIHGKPDHDWTVEELGRVAGLSRSAFHSRFLQLLGYPPAQYVARWRIQLGAELLRTSQRSLLSIAHEVGYGSEPAFCRAFKRIVGQAPAAWRRSLSRDACVPEAIARSDMDA